MPANSPSPIAPISPATTLSDVQARSVSEVVIGLVVDASGGLGANPNNAAEDLNVTDSVVLRITPVSSDDNTGTPQPCQ
jgi:hypothetical protein